MRTALLVVGAALAALLSFASAAPIAVPSAANPTAPPPLPPLSIVPPPPSGSYPDFVFVPDAGNPYGMTIDLGLAQTGPWNVPNSNGVGIYDPEQWVVVFYFNNIEIPRGKSVYFRNHPSRAAVALLAYNSMTIRGTIDVSGVNGSVGPNGVTAEPGPGGYRGSRSSFASGTAHAGFGPGGSFSSPPGGTVYGRGGSHATQGWYYSLPTSLPGPVYGNDSITQLIGGSGGSGFQSSSPQNQGGGAGGGAILLAANQSISFPNGRIFANGPFDWLPYGPGSGGSIRIVSDTVDIPSSAVIHAYQPYTNGGYGRIRIERNNFGGIPGGVIPPASITTGNAHSSILFQTVNRQEIRIISVAGQTAPLDPRAGVLGFEPADIFAPTPGPGAVVIEGRYIPRSAPIYLRATAAAGVTQGEIPVTSTPVGDDVYWTRTVTVDFGGGYTCLQARAVILP